MMNVVDTFGIRRSPFCFHLVGTQHTILLIMSHTPWYTSSIDQVIATNYIHYTVIKKKFKPIIDFRFIF